MRELAPTLSLLSHVCTCVNRPWHLEETPPQNEGIFTVKSQIRDGAFSRGNSHNYDSSTSIHVTGDHSVAHPQHSLYFVAWFLENPPGWWADTAATYCPSRTSQLATENKTKYGERGDAQRCTTERGAARRQRRRTSCK